MSIEEMQLFENECKVLCYKGNMSRSNLGSFYNNEQTNWMYQMWLSSKNREGYKLVPVETTAKQNREGVKKFVRHRNENTWSCDAIDDIYKAMIGAADEIN